jgi:hypothetical protein
MRKEQIVLKQGIDNFVEMREESLKWPIEVAHRMTAIYATHFPNRKLIKPNCQHRQNVDDYYVLHVAITRQLL